jgi:hypothetical protein
VNRKKQMRIPPRKTVRIWSPRAIGSRISRVGFLVYLTIPPWSSSISTVIITGALGMPPIYFTDGQSGDQRVLYENTSIAWTDSLGKAWAFYT